MEPVLSRLGRAEGTSRYDPDALADLHTRSRQVAYRGLYGDAFLDRELLEVSRTSWRVRFDDFDPANDLILAAMDGAAPIGLVYASFRLKPEIGALLDNLHVAPEHKGRGVGTALLSGVAQWLVEEHGGAPLHLEVYAPNASAVDFYIHKGGVEVARYRDAVPGGREIDVVRFRWARPGALLGLDGAPT